MKSKLIFLSAFLALLISCSSQKEKINGLSFVAASETINEQHTLPVEKTSANYVSLMPFGFIKNLAFPQIQYNFSHQWFGETKQGVKQYADEFKKKNIQIMIKPHIWVWRSEFTGDIEMKSEESWKILEKSYTTFILDYAELAEEIKAGLFCIGTELEKFVLNRPDYWKDLINEIKKRYSGKLTYAANWDEFKRVPFWSELDYIGIDAYFPLSAKKTPTVQDFELGWSSNRNIIKEIQKKYKKSVLFTEYGYRSVNYYRKRTLEF